VKQLGESDLQRANAYGVKSLVRRILLLPGLNNIVVGCAKPFVKKFPLSARLPVRRLKANYRMLSGEYVTLVDTSRCEFAREVFWGDGCLLKPRDVALLYTLERLAAEADLFADVGSYTGLFSLIALKSSRQIKVKAFEIMPDNFFLFWRNIIANNLVNRCDLRLLGLGRKSGYVDMPQAYNDSILPSSLSLSSSFSNGVRIPVSTLDEEISLTSTLKALVKIDVEGFEKEVFAGGERFFDSLRPDILCELLPGSRSTDWVFQWSAERDYNCYQFTSDGLILVNTPKASAAGRDWLITRKSKAQLESLLAGVVAVSADSR